MHDVTRMRQLPENAATRFAARYGLQLNWVAADMDIPASYWGAPEAGVIATRLFVRADTPVHSLLHTAAHILVMSPERRAALHTDCGGSDAEEAAVCYLQCLLADTLQGYSQAQLFEDMDAWGYSFRLGSSRAWFTDDAQDAANTLEAIVRAAGASSPTDLSAAPVA